MAKRLNLILDRDTLPLIHEKYGGAMDDLDFFNALMDIVNESNRLSVANAIVLGDSESNRDKLLQILEEKFNALDANHDLVLSMDEFVIGNFPLNSTLNRDCSIFFFFFLNLAFY